MTTPSDVGSRSPLSPTDIDESTSGRTSTPSAVTSATGGVRSKKLSRGNSQRHHTITPSLLTSSESTPVTILVDPDGVEQGFPYAAVLTAVSEPPGRDSHESSREGDGRRPVIRVTTDITSEGGHGVVSPVQHVDSGVRLAVEEVRLPVELPPVYSPT